MPRLTPQLANAISRDYSLNDDDYERKHFKPVVQRANNAGNSTSDSGVAYTPQQLFQYHCWLNGSLDNGAVDPLCTSVLFIMQMKTITSPAAFKTTTPSISDPYAGVYLSNDSSTVGRLSLPSQQGLPNQRWYLRMSWFMGPGQTNHITHTPINNCTVRSTGIMGTPIATVMAGVYWISYLFVLECTNTSRCTLTFDRPQSIAGSTSLEQAIDIFVTLAENTGGSLPSTVGTNVTIVA